MKRAASVLVFVLLAVVCFGGAILAQAGKPDAQGRVGPQAGKAMAAAAAPTKACLELHNGTAVFWFDLTIDPNAFPYKITGGIIKGNICGAPNWKVTGGSLGGTLTISGQGNPPTAGCATKIDVKGTSNPAPPSWGGTYGFNGSNTGFNQQTLFLGYTKCP